MLHKAVHHLNGFMRSRENKRAITMKRYLVLALAALALALAAPSAFATRVIFDPPSPNAPLAVVPTTTDCTQGTYPNTYTPCNISQR